MSNPCSDLLSLSSSLLSPKLGPLPVDNFDYVNPLLAIALSCEVRHWSSTPNSCSVCSPMKWNYEKKPGPVVLGMKQKANQNVLLYMIYFWLLPSFQLTGLTGLLNHWLGFRSVMLETVSILHLETVYVLCIVFSFESKTHIPSTFLSALLIIIIIYFHPKT